MDREEGELSCDEFEQQEELPRENAPAKKHKSSHEESPYAPEDLQRPTVELQEGLLVPGKLYNKLLDHQKTSLEWLWELHQQKAGGILGDEMGLGKTLQVISLWAALDHSRTSGPCLVVCPATVLMQWVREIRRWAPEISTVELLHHSQGSSDPGNRLAMVRAVTHPPGDDAGRCSVLVCSYDTVRQHSTLLLDAPWQYVVLDEGHKIRNPDAEITQICKRFGTRHRLILTGAPIQNKLTELWSLVDFVFPGKLGALPTFEEQFALPIAAGTYANASEFSVQAACQCSMILRDVIRPYLLRRLKSDVKVKLPDKTETVLFCYLTDEQRRAYEIVLSSDLVASVLSQRVPAFAAITSLQKVCNHPHLVTWDGKLIGTTKEHDANDDDEPRIPGAESKREGYGDWRMSGKMRVLNTVLRVWHTEGQRVIIFCQTRQMLDIVESYITPRFAHLRLDGTTPVARRLGLIDRFNEDPSIFCFILTTRAGGLGINLTGANRVVIIDPDWNPANDLQARERAWRVGQTRDVAVYRLVTGGTIEEKVFQRQIFKQALSNRILTERKTSNRFLKKSDLRDLLARPSPPENAAERAGGGSSDWLAAERSYADVSADVVARAEAAAEEAAAAKAAAAAAKKNGVKNTDSSQPIATESSQPIVSTTLPNLQGTTPAQISDACSGVIEGDGSPSQQDSSQSQTGMLEKLLRGELVAGAVDHDKANGGGSGRGSTMAGVKARQVAERAAAALRKSREEYEDNDISTPTWTGRSGVRFGSKLSSNISKIQGRDEGEGNKTFFASGGRTGVIGSSALLKQIHDRGKRKEEAVTAAMATAEDEKAGNLLSKICDFFRSRGGKASSDEIVKYFNRCSDPHLLKQLLKQVAKLEGRTWKLDIKLLS